MKESEKKLERKLVSEIKKRGGLCLKLLSTLFTGLPDRICLLPGGLVIFCEIKTTGLKPSPRQLYVHSILRKLGFPMYIVDSTETLNDLLRYADKK